MLREYLISEAMHALGIPTTRSLAVALTGEVVMRTTPLPGAVLARVASSHIRVGTFQLAAALGRRDVLEALLDHAIGRHDSELADLEPGERPLAFLEGVIERQAALVARWVLVGFVHGVMNTDNMAVSGETIDYGPCAFLDAYDPATVFSSIDQQGRYAYGNQPGIAHWNLARLAESLLPLVPGEGEAALERARGVLATYPERFARHHAAGARAKLGLANEEQGDGELFAALLRDLQESAADFTATFAALPRLAEASAQRSGEQLGQPPVERPGDVLPSATWRQAWRARLERQPGSMADAVAGMRRVNPVVIPRNHQVEAALEAAEVGEMAKFDSLLAAISDPFSETPGNEPYRSGPPPGSSPYRTFCGT
jgi:uncharacterized protein YdiU (UPF0061 family)